MVVPQGGAGRRGSEGRQVVMVWLLCGGILAAILGIGGGDSIAGVLLSRASVWIACSRYIPPAYADRFAIGCLRSEVWSKVRVDLSSRGKRGSGLSEGFP
jgi:hypothetical protein